MAVVAALGRFSHARLCAILAFLLGVATNTAMAHTGSVSFSRPLSGIVVDGDLSDWPEGLVSYPVNSPGIWADAPSDSADHEAWFRVGHNVEENAIYVAVEVRDESIVIDSTDTWNSQDGVEVFIELSHGDLPNTQVAVRGINVPDPQDGNRHREVSWSRRDNRHVYEWKLDVESWGDGEVQVGPGQAFGFDVAVIDRDGDGSFSWMAWGPVEAQKFGSTSEPLGDVFISGTRLSQVRGSARWKSGDEDTPPRGVRLASRDFPALELELPTDDEGRYETIVPMGNYTLSAIDTRLAGEPDRVNIKLSGLHSNVAPLLLELISREVRLAELQAELAAVEDWPHFRVTRTGIDAPARKAEPWPSGLTGHIAYLADRDFNDGEHQEVWVMDLAGGETIKLTNNHGGNLVKAANTSVLLKNGSRIELPTQMAGRPGWSADGARVAFGSTGESGNIWVVDADWRNAKQLTHTDAAESRPVWSPDGGRLAYLARTAEDLHLFVMRSDGSEGKRVTDLSVDDARVSWSPDGTQLTFASSSSGNAEIYVVEAAGGEAMNLTDSESAETSPDWSPDGETILFDSNHYRPPQIWSMNPDGTNAHNLTNAIGFSGQGRWSPDGSKIVFESEREWQRELYVMNADGSEQVRLTRDPQIFNEGWDAQWIPAASPSLSLLPTSEDQLTRGDAGSVENFRNGSPKSPWFSHMHFANLSDVSLAVYRLDYDGKERRYHTLVPGESVQQQSTRYHFWRLKTVSDGAVIGELAADRKRMVVLVE